MFLPILNHAIKKTLQHYSNNHSTITLNPTINIQNCDIYFIVSTFISNFSKLKYNNII